jgi:hypothetical protein
VVQVVQILEVEVVQVVLENHQVQRQAVIQNLLLVHVYQHCQFQFKPIQ